MMKDTILLYIHIHIFLTIRQLKMYSPIFLTVDIARATHRKQSCIKLHTISHIAFKLRDTLWITQYKFLAMLAPTDVHRLSLHPPFSLGSFSNLAQCLVTISSAVIYCQVLGCNDTTHLPLR